MKTILLTGATGMIGIELLGRLLRDDALDLRVIAPTRRAIGVGHPRLANPLVDAMTCSDPQLRDALREAPAERVDVFACCLGSTLRKAGSPGRFHAIDHDLVLRWARVAHELGARHALLVSAVGANPKAQVFYLRVKGQTERDLAGLGFERVDLLRPGQLLGAREESRPLERLAQLAARAYSPWLGGELSRYRAIAAAEVASAMAALIAHPGPPGVHLHHHDELRRLAASR